MKHYRKPQKLCNGQCRCECVDVISDLNGTPRRPASSPTSGARTAQSGSRRVRAALPPETMQANCGADGS
eukprot:2352137-Pleurochrysis_carterae.AAC.1